MQVHWHRLITGVLAAMHDMAKAGEGDIVDFWVLKALAQLSDLRLSTADDSTFSKAEKMLLSSESIWNVHSVVRLSCTISPSVSHVCRMPA